ncbi:Uncharacterized protein TCM_039611 [Theobroma cacao]|uniref:Uncharacterized protein n=1 Tax=Theobroma cacao TaxID=3641 RepID=A0A061GRG9_THECC|nr:Uncharacterized protein TCM_039611 [Theobroma cacao]
MPNVKLMITYSGHWVDDTYKSSETRVRGVGSDLSFSGLMKLVKYVVRVNSQNHKIELHALLNHVARVSRLVISDDEDLAKTDIAHWNDEMEDDCADNYIVRHDDCLEEDKCENKNIPECNHANEDVECNDPIYNNPIIGDNGIHSPDDSDQERGKCKGILSMDYSEGKYDIFPNSCDRKV